MGVVELVKASSSQVSFVFSSTHNNQQPCLMKKETITPQW